MVTIIFIFLILIMFWDEFKWLNYMFWESMKFAFAIILLGILLIIIFG